MAEQFSAQWMNTFQQEWNKEPDLSDALAEIDFNSVIGYGYQDEPTPRGIINVVKGKVIASGAYNGETLNWDIRAKRENWDKWMADGIGMMGLGMAYTTGKMKFLVGDYGAMIKNPRMAGPFIKSFSVMGRVK